MPDYLPGSMGAVGGILNVQAMQNSIAGQELANKENAQKIEMQRIAIEQAARSRQAAMDVAMRRAGQPTPNMASFDPNGGGPSPDELAAKEGSDQPGTGAGLQKPKLSDLHMGEYQKALDAAKTYGLAGDSVEQEKYSKAAETALTSARAAQAEERKQDEERWQNIYDLTSAAQDSDRVIAEQKLNKVVIPAGLKRYGPQFMDTLKQMGIVPDENGVVRYTPQVAKAIETIGDMALKNVDRIKAEQRAEAEQRKKEEAQSREDFRTSMVEVAKTNQELRRQGLKLAEDVAADRRDKAKADRAKAAEKEVTNDLYKDPIWRDYSKVEIARDQAQVIIETLNAGGKIDAPQARQLQIAYRNIAEGFRARAGGKYAQQSDDKFNGLLQNIDKWVESFGTGTPAFGTNTARTVANSITGMNDIYNKNVVITSLQAKELAAKKGGDPDNIPLKGSLQALQRSGQLKVVEDKGKRYLVIGTGDNAVRFEDKPSTE